MNKYSRQTRMLVAVDCIIFGFDGAELKILLVHRALEPEKGKWSLMGGFVEPNEGLDAAAARVMKRNTGLEGLYLEQFAAFGAPSRDPIERTVSVAYFALLDIRQYQQQLNEEYHAVWFPVKDFPQLIFDHPKMVEMARAKLQDKAMTHPILFELLPDKFTIPQMHSLYEGVYDVVYDKRNFSRNILATGLLIKLNEKEKTSSRKGAFYYKLDKRKYKNRVSSVLGLGDGKK